MSPLKRGISVSCSYIEGEIALNRKVERTFQFEAVFPVFLKHAEGNKIGLTIRCY